jgi:hypothetical protein
MNSEHFDEITGWIQGKKQEYYDELNRNQIEFHKVNTDPLIFIW